MNYFKELKEVEEVTGWGKLYYNFIDLDRYDSILMLNYLIDTEPIIKQNCFDEGYEDYLQYSDSFIQEKIIGVTPHLIRKMMDDLEKHEYISVHHAGNDIRRPRYVKLNYDKLLKALGIKRCIKGCINAGANEGLNAGANEGLNHPTNNLAQNTLTDYQSTRVPEKHYYGETSSPVVTETTSSTKTTTKNDTTDAGNYRKRKTIISTPDPEEGQKKRISRKDQLVNYVDSLSYSAETKDVLRKWIFQIGLPKGVTVPQLTDMVNNLQTACKEESIVRQSINESYLHNWFGFYPPKTTATKRVEYQPEISCDRADPKNISKEVF